MEDDDFLVDDDDDGGGDDDGLNGSALNDEDLLLEIDNILGD